MTPGPLGDLLCRIGRHAPAPDGLWNAGYCFTRCRRCGRDMVRSAFGEWHVPRGYRVVWRPPADGRVRADLVPEPPRRRSTGAPRKSGHDPFDFGDFDHPDDSAGHLPERRAIR